MVKVLRRIPNPVDLGATYVGIPSITQTTRLSVNTGATFVESDLISSISAEFTFARSLGVQHLHAGYTFEEGVVYYATEQGVLTTDEDMGVSRIGIGTSANGLFLGFQAFTGEFIDPYVEFFTDENGVGFDDVQLPVRYSIFLDAEGNFFTDSGGTIGFDDGERVN